MKALFVGLGSIGQRHLVNFKALTGQKYELLAVRHVGREVIVRDNQAEHCKSLAEYYGFVQYDYLEEALEARPNLAFITNPTIFHLETAIAACRSHCHIFIEKPLAAKLIGVEELTHLVQNNNLVAMVGYQTRFHPCFRKTSEVIKSRVYGEVISAGFEWGTYLPTHHPYEDYSESYAAKRSLGGGVVLGLIHEIDMICSFWGLPTEIQAVGGKLSALKMEAEDTVAVLLTYHIRGKEFPVSLFLSYAQTKEIRRFKIQFDKATLICDLVDNSLSVFGSKGSVLVKEKYTKLKRNDLFVQELEEFIDAVNNKRDPSPSLYDGVVSLEMALQIKEAIGA